MIIERILGGEPIVVEGTPHQFQKGTLDPIILKIQNVVDYYHTTMYTTGVSWRREMIPNAAPPFRSFWTEFEMGSQHYEKEEPTRQSQHFGLLFEVWDTQGEVEYPSDMVAFFQGDIRKGIEETLQMAKNRAQEVTTKSLLVGHCEALLNQRKERWIPWVYSAIPEWHDLRWIYQIRIVTSPSPKRGPILNQTLLFLGVGENGTIGSFTDAGNWLMGIYDSYILELVQKSSKFPMEAVENAVQEETIGSILMPALLAVSFMHCKNVLVQEHSPEPLKKKQRRRGDPERQPYRTIHIAPMKDILKGQGKAESDGLPKALHICRGHFATYSEEKPLFGKYSGTFWKPMHVRGSTEKGVTNQNYIVDPPQD